VHIRKRFYVNIYLYVLCIYSTRDGKESELRNRSYKFGMERANENYELKESYV
jgi:hypothetical protein